MKKQLQEFLSMNYGRLLFLAMIIFIGQGVAFSQGTITVTANTDDGAGSLRQAVRDAVDGDVIDFDGAITEITLDSTLSLGDKTLTIDGGGDVVLNRDLVAIDSFRLVTITGVPDKVVTIMDLTIQNGLAKGAGGGLEADHSAGGQTMLEGIIFKDNHTLGGKGDTGGGGARLLGFDENTVSMAIDCEFIGNSTASGYDGGGAHAENATFLRCSFTGNEGDAAGGARAQGNVLFDHCTFTDNTADDDGGAIRLSSGSATASNSTFEGNAAGDNGGAIFMARGSILNCKFYNNTSGNLAGAVFANNNAFVINSVLSGNSSVNDGGGICIDDEGIVENCIITNNTSGVTGGGVWFKGGGDVGNLIGSVVANNAADSIGGGIHLATGNVINCVVTGNYSAENGGAISGDGKWYIANSIIYDNDAAGDAKNIQFISNGDGTATAAENCAIDVNAYDAAAWTASNITTLDASPFVGGSEADSLMLPYSSPLIDAGAMNTTVTDLLPATALNGVNRVINSVVDLGAYERLQSFVVTTDADDGAGSLRQIIADAVDGESIITFDDGITSILLDAPLTLGDKTLIIDGGDDVILDGAFNADPALDINRVINITGALDKVVTIENLTIQNGVAASGADGGGLLADHSAGGQTMLNNLVFTNNTADDMGGAVSIIGYKADTLSMVTNTEFVGNSSVDDGGAAVAAYTMFSGCTFTDNESADAGGAVRADDEASFDNCTFTGNVAAGSGGAIRLSDVTASATNSTFDANAAGGGAGAVFMARGTLRNCEFMNNTAVEEGGAVFANQNESYIYDCVFTGNASELSGGAVYVDDGGMLSNCVITYNTATVNGGGVFMEGNIAPSSMVGCVVANNTSTAKGGGVYVQAGDVINCIITENTAGTNGGAITGETGPWFIANTIVWDNDAVDADKNIEVVSNTATDHAANCGIDATAYNDTWTATNIVTLNASPFVGGSGVDSLYSLPSAGLIDAGTLDFGVAAMLPEMDLDGNDRIQGTIDMGVYETEVIGVLGVSLNVSSLEVSVGGTETLVATIDPAEAGNKTVIWSSSDEGIATVVDGVVTGVADGTATITATTADGGFTATADVTVFTAVTGVTLDQTAVTLEVDQTVTLVATIEPANASNQTIGWVSGNEDVATVDGGLVTAIAPGVATISAITMDGSFIAICQVTVTEPTVAVTGVSLDQTSLALEPGNSETLVATVAPEGATDKTVSWSTSDAGVATVADGVVTAVADGTCTITVTTTDGGFTATCDVTVETVGIEDHSTGFRLYPNPVTGGKLYIEVSDPGIRAFEIYNVLGVVVHQQKVNVQKSYELDTPDMKSGIYFVRMIKDQSISVEQFIVE